MVYSLSRAPCGCFGVWHSDRLNSYLEEWGLSCHRASTHQHAKVKIVYNLAVACEIWLFIKPAGLHNNISPLHDINL